MKKLMIAAAAVAVAGGVFAGEKFGNIFDYKASVKYVDFKKVSAKADDGEKANILIKVVKSAKLTGYLVTPQCCPCDAPADGLNGGPCERFGKEPAFLVLKNAASRRYNQDYGLSEVKLMPANLLTEWWSTKRQADWGKKFALQAQGYLFSGVGKRDVPDPEASPFYGLGDRDPVLRTAATQFLFGYYNVVDKVNPSDPQSETDFIEPFLDHAGFGKAQWNYDKWSTSGGPCSLPGEDDKDSICLVSLSGHLIGGSFACAQNGNEAIKDGSYWTAAGALWSNAEAYICQGWNDYTENASSAGGVNGLPQAFANAYVYNVVCGTWSIKVNTKIENGADHYADVVTCAQRIDRNFDINTFDTPAATKRGSALMGLQDNFVEKWFK